MARQLPREVIDGWAEREGPVVVTTVDTAGIPNSIYASIVHLTDDGRVAVADNYFDKTAANISSGTPAVILFITGAKKAYQIKGSLEYHGSGPLYEEMLLWADPKHPRKGVALMNPDTVYHGSEKLL
ncbi:MAG: pyridoxamine 5'-phosphate oxidase family protein [Chitinispirillaceae bacterium]|nr:pyridoxamine 5'-phosphate oxidase family protein [Chitinispirillaceae bacterium]